MTWPSRKDLHYFSAHSKQEPLHSERQARAPAQNWLSSRMDDFAGLITLGQKRTRVFFRRELSSYGLSHKWDGPAKMRHTRH
jgi:hypothetical protein